MIVCIYNNSVPKGILMRTLFWQQTMNIEPQWDTMTSLIKITSANPEKASNCLRLSFWYQRIYKNQEQLKRNENFKKLFFEYTHRNNGRYQNYIETSTL